MRDLWINLVVADVAKAKQFYQAVGFDLNPRFSESNEVASLVFNEKTTVVMLFQVDFFKDKLPAPLVRGEMTNEVLLSIGADSVEDADQLVARAIEAGGRALGHPQWQGNMYNTGFIDLDGHWWNILYYKSN